MIPTNLSSRRVLHIAYRLGRKERMMEEAFGAAYDAYRARTHGLVPGIW